jgi:hypothetical protein
MAGVVTNTFGAHPAARDRSVSMAAVFNGNPGYSTSVTEGRETGGKISPDVMAL